MDINTIQQRAFILSSLRRLNISITTKSYKFVDEIIKEGWMPPLGSLNEVDNIIKNKYNCYIKNCGM